MVSTPSSDRQLTMQQEKPSTRLRAFSDLDTQAVLQLIATGQGSKTWYLLNLAMWWRHFIAGETLEVE